MSTDGHGPGHRRRGGEEFMVPRARPDSYYGKPIIKEPVWRSPEVPGYLFLGGLAGASSVLAGFAHAVGHHADLLGIYAAQADAQNDIGRDEAATPHEDEQQIARALEKPEYSWRRHRAETELDCS